MTAKVFTFGWSAEFVIRPLAERGVSKEDTVVLIANKPESDYAKKRADEALQEVKKFLSMAGIENVHYAEIELGESFERICRQILRIVLNVAKSDEAVEFYLTGGMRVLVVAALVVAVLLTLKDRDVEVIVYREDRPIAYEIPIQLLRFQLNVTKSQLEIMNYLKINGEGTFEDLAIGRSEITVRKHLTKLREIGLVTYTLRGRKQVYRLTPIGELVLEALW